jgi:hypothetical protein
MGNIIRVDFAQKVKKAEPAMRITAVDDRSDIKPINWHKVALFMIVFGIVALAIWSKS